MIDPEDRFFSEGQGYFGPPDNPITEAHCNIWDWDQLRMVKLKGTAKLFPPEEEVENSVFAQFADLLSPEVRAVTVNNEGLLTGVSTDPEEDETIFIGYLPFSFIEPTDCRTIQYSKLQEIDRLGPGVDLLSYEDESGKRHKVVFKFNPLGKPLRLQMAWDELNLLQRLPPHPNLIPFDHIVLEDVESRVIGFTTKYIPGGTLDNPKVPFRFEWLQQLTEVVDFLNLELGVIHQDIAPRNLLLDPDRQKVVLFDFDRAAHGKHRLIEHRDDVTGVAFTLYELITNDVSFETQWDRTIKMVQNMPEWPCNRELDSDVSKFRDFLNEWVATRKSNRGIELNAPSQLTWPSLPDPPDYSVPFEYGKDEYGETVWETGWRDRRTALEKGQYCFRWERPPQSRLSKKAGNDV